MLQKRSPTRAFTGSEPLGPYPVMPEFSLFQVSPFQTLAITGVVEVLTQMSPRVAPVGAELLTINCPVEVEATEGEITHFVPSYSYVYPFDGFV